MVQEPPVRIQSHYPVYADRRREIVPPIRTGAMASPRVCMAMQRVANYRRHAYRCRERAERPATPAERELLLELARHWDAIADLHEQLGPVSYDES